MEKVAKLRGFCGGQLYTNPKWYRLHNQTLRKWEDSKGKWESMGIHLDTTDIRGMQDLGRAKSCPEAIKEAEISLSEGGIPIGAVLVKDGEVISRGHNRLIQNDSVILHGEMDAIENAKGLDYPRCLRLGGC